MKKLTGFVIVLAKVLEVFVWVASALIVASLVVIGIGKSDLLKLFSSIQNDTYLSIGGFSIDMNTIDPADVLRSFVIFFITALIICVLMAIIFRKIHLVFKTAEGKTKYSIGSTPFQPSIVRMIREIGFLSLAIPIAQIIMSIIANLVLGHNGPGLSVSFDLGSIFFGLVVLCLSQFFAYGAKLQEDTEGLV